MLSGPLSFATRMPHSVSRPHAAPWGLPSWYWQLQLGYMPIIRAHCAALRYPPLPFFRTAVGALEDEQSQRFRGEFIATATSARGPFSASCHAVGAGKPPSCERSISNNSQTLSMGGLPAIALETLQRMVLPESPPGLASPSASSFSSRSSPSTEQAAWGPRAAAPLASMSHYDKSSAADMSIDNSTEANQSRPESSGNSSTRQQLPSLSSIFGPPPPVRPVNSPHLDRPAPYLSHSPLDRPRLPSGGSSSGSYFPPAHSPPASQPRSAYDVNYDAERQHHHPPTSFPGPRSPGYREPGHSHSHNHNHNHSRSDSRYDPETNRWSMHHEVNRQEYSLGSRDSPYRSPGDRFRHHIPGPKDPVHDYHENRQGHASGSNHQTTPTSTIGSSSDLAISVSKDGLGPKIWTGTHFLPRFVRAAEVPGEGMCYFYDDGTHCKTVIDGEAVNAHWGVTKAGKPRKRLAIACVTCREKKIKCDPDYPRCVQCEKFGRICKFKNAPRGGHNTSPSTPPAELDDGRPVLPKHIEPRPSVSDAGSPASPRGGARHSSPEEGPSKRMKVGSGTYVSNGELFASRSGSLDHSKSQHTEQRSSPEMPKIPDEVLSRAWQTDPYISDPHSITAVLTKFFAQVDSTMITRFIPEEVVRNWIPVKARRKAPEDLMFFYSMLAVGVALSNGPEPIAHEYAQVAHYAQKMLDVRCLQLVQSRILLAVYYIATCRHREADEMICSAVAASSCMQLHLELERSTDANMTVYPFGMNRAGYAESRRRTFWSLFMLERLSGYFPDRPVMINAEDIYTQLPADPASFERLVEVQMPMFNPYASSFAKLAEQPLHITGYLVELVHIWSESQVFIHRTALRPASTEMEIEKLQNLIQRAEDWRASLPSRLKFGGSNLESAALSGNVGSFLTVHLLYHHTMIKLNRHRHGAGQLPVETRSEYLQKCRDHANGIIEILDSLERILRVRPTLLGTPPPVMAIAVTEAVDVLSAAGPMTAMPDTIDIVRVAKSAVEKMINVWKSSSRSLMVIEQRLQKLEHIRKQGSRPATPNDDYCLLLSTETRDRTGNRWQILDPIEKFIPLDMDMLYSSLN
ncbi:hypothetical protein PT974_06669 [Cladobotryum mycophilum]|uniref:Zn(2)-C6 fungal-type domain-containing protein n=1 Tax=Cladobotryum mycophilum TaxID=491253 RepID=A0ABR0SNA0_9HYPO